CLTRTILRPPGWVMCSWSLIKHCATWIEGSRRRFCAQLPRGIRRLSLRSYGTVVPMPRWLSMPLFDLARSRLLMRRRDLYVLGTRRRFGTGGVNSSEEGSKLGSSKTFAFRDCHGHVIECIAPPQSDG